ncbi:hypothetical protein BV22DRAFT_1034766 [Leucogyrophana mollusca]|uniref:Uncharacterized protein n=1 Tax=Leucogyrophana mollusca TaxID=85980 RepID=A0ACB8BJ12_9AGAM|nr:hypothetical protein BV22DRAFT_1034766 [Leucogyrophana mollusca]
MLSSLSRCEFCFDTFQILITVLVSYVWFDRVDVYALSLLISFYRTISVPQVRRPDLEAWHSAGERERLDSSIYACLPCIALETGCAREFGTRGSSSRYCR